MIFEGKYTYNKMAQQYSAILLIDNVSNEITLTINGDKKSYPLCEIKISDSLGSLPDVLYFPDGGCFTCDKKNQLRKIIRSKKKKKLEIIDFLERRKATCLYLFMSLILMTTLVFQYVIPYSSGIIAKNIPIFIQKSLGEETLALLDKSELKPSKLPLEKQQEISLLFNNIMPIELKNSPLRPSLIFRDFPGEANALTLADGTIIITDELINLTKDENEIASVLLHEMGHHYHQHIMHTLVSSSSIKLLFLWMVGKTSNLEELLINSGSLLLSLSYSRDMELEADQFALDAMIEQERPIEMMKSIFTKLSEQHLNVNSKLLSSHPSWQERLDNLDKALLQQ
uniref:M48 family metallopeptidase n=1 Tax=Providencia stuartii TaxID=588 RepID=A0AAI9D8H5_PROST|nr:M48 family metallopeptidase [Providencia stuartii]